MKPHSGTRTGSPCSRPGFSEVRTWWPTNPHPNRLCRSGRQMQTVRHAAGRYFALRRPRRAGRWHILSVPTGSRARGGACQRLVPVTVSRLRVRVRVALAHFACPARPRAGELPFAVSASGTVVLALSGWARMTRRTRDRKAWAGPRYMCILIRRMAF